MTIKEMIKAVTDRYNGRVHTRTLAAQMRVGGKLYRSTTTGNLGKAYYQIKKAESAGMLVRKDDAWCLTELGAAWCGAANVAKP